MIIDLSFRSGEHPALQPGMFRRLQTSAGSQPHAFVISRSATRAAAAVHLVTALLLRRRHVTILRFLRDQAIRSAGLHAGDRLVAPPSHGADRRHETSVPGS